MPVPCSANRSLFFSAFLILEHFLFAAPLLDNAV